MQGVCILFDGLMGMFCEQFETITLAGTGSPEDEFVEYDMDTEDEEWLENFNQGQPRLTEAKFERMIWRLEIACANATEKTLRAAGDKTRRGYSPLTTRLQELGMRIGGTHLRFIFECRLFKGHFMSC